MRRVAPAMALAGILAVGGCGGGSAPDAGDARGVVKSFVTAVNARDGKRICTELVTAAYLRQSTGQRGARAVRACEQQIRTVDPSDSKLALGRVRSARVEGDRATVVADLRAGREVRRTTFRLRRQGESFRLESGTGD